MDWEKKRKRISQRNWAQIKGLWVPHIPDIEPVGSAPPKILSEDEECVQILHRVEDNDEYRVSNENVPELIGWDSVFLLKKAAHVLCGMEKHLNNGLVSWASNSAYHSALFSARGILGMLGISIIEKWNKYYLIDIFPGPRKGQKNRRHQRGELRQFMRLPMVQQRHWWYVFQEVIDKAEVQVWDSDVVDSLVSLDCRQFALYRNKLIYRQHGWVFDDLMNPYQGDGYFETSGCDLSELIDPSRCDFTFHLARVLFWMGEALLESFEEDTPVLQSERRELRGVFDSFSVGPDSIIFAGVSTECGFECSRT